MEPLWGVPYFMTLLTNSRKEAVEEWRCSLAAQAAAGSL